MVVFNSAWEADFLQGVNKLPTRFLEKPTGLDGHHIGTKANVTSHPDLRVQRLLIELGTRLDTHTDANGVVTKRALFDTGNSADNFVGLPSSGVDGVSGGQPAHYGSRK